MRPRILLLVGCALLALFALARCDGSGSGAPAGGDAVSDGQGGPASGDASADAGDTPGPPTGASFVGNFYAAYYGDERGHVDVVVAADGRLTGTATLRDGSTLSGEGTLTPAGAATLSLTGSTPLGPYTISYTGTFRLESGRALGSGQWSSTSGYTGEWVTYRLGDEFGALLDASQDELRALCERLGALCPDAGIGTPEECVAGAICQIATFAAKSTQCVGIYNEWMLQWAAVESSDGCDVQPSDEWTRLCPDAGVCYE